MIKVAAIQFASMLSQADINRQKAAKLIGEAADQGGCLVVLPEFWLTGFEVGSIARQAETMRGATVGMLRRIARQKSVFIVGGSMAEKRDNRLYNTIVAVDENGEIAAKYRKAHLHPEEEESVFSPGDDWVLANYGGCELGFLNCYDIYFPEFARNIILRGAQLLIIPIKANESINEMRLLARARAVENSCHVIMVNQAQEQGAGHSLIIAPDGSILAEAGQDEEILLMELDILNNIDLQRKQSFLNRRRNILDEIDNSQL